MKLLINLSIVSSLLLSISNPSLAQVIKYGSSEQPYNNEILLEEKIENTCFNSMKQVFNEIKVKGGKGIYAEYKSSLPNWIDSNLNPTNKFKSIGFVLSSPNRGEPFSAINYVSENDDIMSSPKLQEYWANLISQNCSEVGRI